LGILLGSLDQAQSSMWRVSAGCTKSVTICCKAHLLPMMRLTISGVQTWSGTPSRQSRTL
jgi:hypothetical protein